MHRLFIVAAASPASAAEQLDHELELAERHPPERLGQGLARQQREAARAPARPWPRGGRRSACATRDPDRHGEVAAIVAASGATMERCRPLSAGPVVDGAPRGQPQAGDVPLSNLWPSSSRAQRAHADRPRGRHAPPPPRPHRLRARRPRARGAAAARGLAAAQPRGPSLWRRLTDVHGAVPLLARRPTL